MKFSEHWLRTLVNPALDTAALSAEAAAERVVATLRERGMI